MGKYHDCVGQRGNGAHFGRERSRKKDMSPQLGFIPEEYILDVSRLNDEQSLVSIMIDVYSI